MALVGQWVLVLFGVGFTVSLVTMLALCRASHNGDRLSELFPKEPEDNSLE